jgi:hypothetical protein
MQRNKQSMDVEDGQNMKKNIVGLPAPYGVKGLEIGD